MGTVDLDPVDVDSDEEVPPAPAPADTNPCFDLLQQIRQDTSAIDLSAEPDTEHPQVDPAQVQEDAEMKGMPDRELLEKVLNANNPSEPFNTDGPKPTDHKDDPEYLPSTLHEALGLKGTDFMNKCFRFLVRLRASKGGCDRGFLPNPRSARRASKALNWHQQLDFFILFYAVFHLFHFVSIFIFSHYIWL